MLALSFLCKSVLAYLVTGCSPGLCGVEGRGTQLPSCGLTAGVSALKEIPTLESDGACRTLLSPLWRCFYLA